MLITLLSGKLRATNPIRFWPHFRSTAMTKVVRPVCCFTCSTPLTICFSSTPHSQAYVAPLLCLMLQLQLLQFATDAAAVATVAASAVFAVACNTMRSAQKAFEPAGTCAQPSSSLQKCAFAWKIKKKFNCFYLQHLPAVRRHPAL